MTKALDLDLKKLRSRAFDREEWAEGGFGAITHEKGYSHEDTERTEESRFGRFGHATHLITNRLCKSTFDPSAHAATGVRDENLNARGLAGAGKLKEEWKPRPVVSLNFPAPAVQ